MYGQLTLLSLIEGDTSHVLIKKIELFSSDAVILHYGLSLETVKYLWFH
jgi:hypothetical protein